MNALNSAQTVYLRVVKEVIGLLLQGSFTSFRVTERNQGLDISYLMLMLNHEINCTISFSKIKQQICPIFALNAAPPK